MIREGKSKCLGEMGASGVSVLFRKTPGKKKIDEPVFTPIGFAAISHDSNIVIVAEAHKKLNLTLENFGGIVFFTARPTDADIDYIVKDAEGNSYQVRVTLPIVTYNEEEFIKFLNK
jgi:hypothetical protein